MIDRTIDRRGSAAPWIIGIIFVILIVVVIFVLIMVSKQGGNEDQTGITGEKHFNAFVRTLDSESSQSFSGKYLLVFDTTVVAEGSTQINAYTQVKVSNASALDVACWSEKHYLTIQGKEFTDQEQRLNGSRIDCTADPIGTLAVERVAGDLEDLDNTIILNLTAKNGAIKKVIACFQWSAGIITVRMDNPELSCSEGLWKNYSYFDPVNQEYTWLPTGQYLCGTEMEYCDRITSNRCVITNRGTPQHLVRSADKCFYTGLSLSPGESKPLTFTVTTLDYKNQLDFVGITLVDQDRRWDTSKQAFEWKIHEGETNLGAPDSTLRISYQEAD